MGGARKDLVWEPVVLSHMDLVVSRNERLARVIQPLVDNFLSVFLVQELGIEVSLDDFLHGYNAQNILPLNLLLQGLKLTLRLFLILPAQVLSHSFRIPRNGLGVVNDNRLVHKSLLKQLDNGLQRCLRLYVEWLLDFALLLGYQLLDS